MSQNSRGGNLMVPGSILLAGVFISLAIFAGGGDGGSLAPAGGHGGAVRTAEASIRPVGEDDHIRGNRDAKIAIVEFSDYECPFCARLHPTLERAVAENDDVMWVYRNFPLSNHANAASSAAAAECVAKLGGNDAFWSFADALFDNQHALGNTLYESEATKLGISPEAFADCRTSSEITKRIQDDQDDATGAGGRGTPFSVVLTASGKAIPFSGALPYASIEQILEQARAN